MRHSKRFLYVAAGAIASSFSSTPLCQADSWNRNNNVRVRSIHDEPKQRELLAEPKQLATLNDNCEAEIPLSVGETVEGSIDDADNVTFVGCGDVEGTGLFYSVVGSGEGLKIDFNSSLSYSLKVSVLSGQDCNQLVCVTVKGADYFGETQEGDLWGSGSVEWAGVEGEKYHIYAFSEFDETGTISMTLSQGGDLPPNSDCASAIPVSTGDAASGNTKLGGVLPEICGDAYGYFALPTTAPGVFYSFVGTGKTVLFGLVEDETDFDARITLYTSTGENCDSLTCIGDNDVSFIPGYESAIVRTLEQGETYFVFVNGFGKQYGNFTFVVEAVDVPENDACDSATTVAAGDVLAGSTIFATDDGELPYCGPATNETQGVWYAVEGTGGLLQVSLQTFLYVSVFSGDCATLTCLDTGKDNRYPTVFETVAGSQYLLYVSGETEDERHPFNISVSDVPVPKNEQCQDATTIKINGPPMPGSTLGALQNQKSAVQACGEAEDTQGVWYKFIGNGAPLLLGVSGNYLFDEGSTLLSDTKFDSHVTLFTGEPNCGSLVCLDGNDDTVIFLGRGYTSALDFESVEGQEYFVLVHGFGGAIGTFSIELTEVIAPENDDCPLAVSIEPGELVAGSTYFVEKVRSEDDFFDCGGSFAANYTSPGVWYALVGGEGSTISATVNSATAASATGTSFYPQITVFSGDECTALTCVGGQAGLEGSTVIWDSDAAELYYIYIHGDSDSNVGDFELTVLEVTRPENDECQDALVVNPGDVVSVSTEYAKMDVIGDCAIDEESTNPSVWYTLTAPEDVGNTEYSVLVSNYTGDHLLGIYIGDDCGSLSCVANATSFSSDWQAAMATWPTSASQTYFILFQSITFSTNYLQYGEFELTISSNQQGQ